MNLNLNAINWEKSIVAANCPGLEEARLVFVLDQHENKCHLSFLAAVVNDMFHKDKDLILVEESKLLRGEELLEALSSNDKAKAELLKGFIVRGWDHPDRNLWLEDVKSVQNAIECLEDHNESSLAERFRSFAKLAAYYDKVVGIRTDIHEHWSFMQISPLPESEKAFCAVLCAYGKKLLHLKISALVYKTFPSRQRCLQETLMDALENKDIKILVNAGIWHGDPEHSPFKDLVEKLLEQIKDIPFAILNPEKL